MAVLRWDVGSIGGSDGEGEEGDDSEDEQFVITSGVSKERWVPFGCRWDKRFGRGHCGKRSEIISRPGYPYSERNVGEGPSGMTVTTRDASRGEVQKAWPYPIVRGETRVDARVNA